MVENLGWREQSDRIVFYESDLGSRQAYARYLRYAWPGSAVVIDDEEPEPRLLELLADLNPLRGGNGLPSG